MRSAASPSRLTRSHALQSMVGAAGSQAEIGSESSREGAAFPKRLRSWHRRVGRTDFDARVDGVVGLGIEVRPAGRYLLLVVGCLIITITRLLPRHEGGAQ